MQRNNKHIKSSKHPKVNKQKRRWGFFLSRDTTPVIGQQAHNTGDWTADTQHQRLDSRHTTPVIGQQIHNTSDWTAGTQHYSYYTADTQH